MQEENNVNKELEMPFMPDPSKDSTDSTENNGEGED